MIFNKVKLLIKLFFWLMLANIILYGCEKEKLSTNNDDDSDNDNDTIIIYKDSVVLQSHGTTAGVSIDIDNDNKNDISISYIARYFMLSNGFDVKVHFLNNDFKVHSDTIVDIKCATKESTMIDSVNERIVYTCVPCNDSIPIHKINEYPIAKLHPNIPEVNFQITENKSDEILIFLKSSVFPPLPPPHVWGTFEKKCSDADLLNEGQYLIFQRKDNKKWTIKIENNHPQNITIYKAKRII